MTVIKVTPYRGATLVIADKPRGPKGDAGPPGALAPGLLSARPASAAAGQTYTATDTGLTYVWTGSTWLTVGATVSDTYITGASIASGSAAVAFAALNAWVGVTALATPSFTWPAGKIHIEVQGAVLTFASPPTGTPGFQSRLCVTKDAGSHWVPVHGTTLDNVAAGYVWNPQLPLRVTLPQATTLANLALAPGDTVQARVEFRQTAGSVPSTGMVATADAPTTWPVLPRIDVYGTRGPAA